MEGVQKLLSDKDVLKILGKGSRLVTYPEIKEYDSLESLFGKDNKLIILYVNKSDGLNVEGHWVLLTKIIRKGKIIYEFADSYGLLPDDQLKNYSKRWQRESGQDKNYLTRLLYDASLNSNVEIHYNELPVQADKQNVNTCGRWVAIRGYFHKIPLESFQEIFKDLKSKGYDLDKISVKLSNTLNGGQI